MALFVNQVDSMESFLLGGPAFEERRNLDLELIGKHNVFRDEVDYDALQCTILALRPFVVESGPKYFSEKSFKQFLELLRVNPENSTFALNELAERLNFAVSSWERLTVTHESLPSYDLNNPCDLKEIESIWHSHLQVLLEHSWGHIVQYALRVLHLNHNSTSNWEFSQSNKRYDELIRLGMNDLTHGYSKIIRNALAHGDFQYDNSQIRYSARQGEETYSVRQLILKADNLYDTISGMVAAILVFINNKITSFSNSEFYCLPLFIRKMMLSSTAMRSGFSVEDVFIQHIGNETSVIISCLSESRSRRICQNDSLVTAVAAMHFFSPSTTRISVQIDVGRKINPFAVYDMNALDHLCRNGCFPQDYEPLLILWFDEIRLIEKFKMYKSLYPNIRHVAVSETKKRWQEDGIWSHSQYEVSCVLNNVAGRDHLRLNVEVYIESLVFEDEEDLPNELIRIAKQIARPLMCIPRAFESAVDASLYKPNKTLGLPKRIWVNFHTKRARPRRMHWLKEHQVATVEWRVNVNMNNILRGNILATDGRYTLAHIPQTGD